MSIIALTAGALFTEAGKTLTAETVKLAFKKRQDIKDKIIDVFRPELISLNLNDAQSPEEVKALIEAKPEIKAAIQNKIESNQELLKELLEIIKQQAGKDSSQININAKNIGQVINNSTGDITQNNNWS